MSGRRALGPPPTTPKVEDPLELGAFHNRFFRVFRAFRGRNPDSFRRQHRRTACPEYLGNLSTLLCPARDSWQKLFKPPPPTTVTYDQSHFYFGYNIPYQETLERFSVAYRSRINHGGTFEGDLNSGADGDASAPIRRLRRGAYDVSTVDALAEDQAKTPLLIERYPNGHVKAGGNVLYADRHVEWIRWGQKWPMTEEAMDALLSLDALGNS